MSPAEGLCQTRLEHGSDEGVCHQLPEETRTADPSQFIVIDDDTDESSDVDDLSEVSMTSAGGIGKQEFQALLSDIAAQHQRMAASLDTLASRVQDMSVEQVEEAVVRVVSESGHVRGLTEITNVFDKSEVALILACGVRRYEEYQALKGKREDKDIISYRQLQKKFGTNKRTLMEVVQGYKYRYPGGVSTKVPFTTTKPEEGEEEAPARSQTAPASNPSSTKGSYGTTTKILGPFRTTKPSQSRNIPWKSYP